MVTATSKHLQIPSQAPAFNVVQVLQSPLVTALVVVALGAATLPIRVGLGILAFSIAGLIQYPHQLPKGFLYEVAIADLIVRAKLTQTLPNINQHWWHKISPRLILGGIPLANYDHQKAIKELGVKAVYAILEDFEATSTTFFSAPVLEKDWKKNHICYRRLSCQDMTPMQLPELRQAVEWLRGHISRGNTVYVHCKAGRGRSAMVVLAYLMTYEKMSLEQAIEHASSRRNVIALRPCQLARLQEYESSIRRSA